MSSADAVRTRATARRAREREIVVATRRLFDERGLQDAPIEGIAQAVGINKALIYRHFSSKEELFVATMTDYLRELAELMAAASSEGSPAERLRERWALFVDFCLRHPAFGDCALSLMRRPAGELAESVSDAVWLRLGQGMAALLGPLAELLAEGAECGAFRIADPDLAASQLYAQTLGLLQLARVGIGVRRAAVGVPEVFPVSAEQVRAACLSSTLASVGANTATPA
jgi:AcrR family transcriptional regulator